MKPSVTTIMVTEQTNCDLMKVAQVLTADHTAFRKMERKELISLALTKFKTNLLKAIDHSDETALQFKTVTDSRTGKTSNSVRFFRLPVASVSTSQPNAVLSIKAEDVDRLNFIVDKLEFQASTLISTRGIIFNLSSRQMVVEAVLLGALCALLEPDDIISYDLPSYSMFNPKFNNAKVDAFTIELVHLPIVLHQDTVNLILNWRGKADFMVNAFLFKGPMKADSVKVNYASNRTLTLNVFRMDSVSPLVR